MASREDKFTLRMRYPVNTSLDADVVFSGEQAPTQQDYDLLIEYLRVARKTAPIGLSYTDDED